MKLQTYLWIACCSLLLGSTLLAQRSVKKHKRATPPDFNPSEFSRLRLQFASDKSRLGVTDNQVFLQYIMSLGAHGAHKF